MVLYILCVLFVFFTFAIMFWLEDTPIAKAHWWLRLPIINIPVFLLIVIFMFIEEIYLTFHPIARTKWVKTSIKQIYFDK